jgi:hypothetical protein
MIAGAEAGTTGEQGEYYEEKQYHWDPELLHN